jgi:hypothetical protein
MDLSQIPALELITEDKLENILFDNVKNQNEELPTLVNAMEYNLKAIQEAYIKDLLKEYGICKDYHLRPDSCILNYNLDDILFFDAEDSALNYDLSLKEIEQSLTGNNLKLYHNICKAVKELDWEATEMLVTLKNRKTIYDKRYLAKIVFITRNIKGINLIPKRARQIVAWMTQEFQVYWPSSKSKISSFLKGIISRLSKTSKIEENIPSIIHENEKLLQQQNSMNQKMNIINDSEVIVLAKANSLGNQELIFLEPDEIKNLLVEVGEDDRAYLGFDLDIAAAYIYRIEDEKFLIEEGYLPSVDDFIPSAYQQFSEATPIVIKDTGFRQNLFALHTKFINFFFDHIGLNKPLSEPTRVIHRQATDYLSYLNVLNSYFHEQNTSIKPLCFVFENKSCAEDFCENFALTEAEIIIGTDWPDNILSYKNLYNLRLYKINFENLITQMARDKIPTQFIYTPDSASYENNIARIITKRKITAVDQLKKKIEIEKNNSSDTHI